MRVVKFALIVLTALVVRMAAVPVCGGDPIAGAIPYREIVAKSRVFPFAIGMLGLTYAAFLAVYLSFRSYWVGRPVMTGLRFSALFGLLWVVGMVEASFILGTGFWHELLFGFCEVPPLVTIGALGGVLFGPGAFKGSKLPVNAGKPSLSWKTPISIVLAILAGRYFSYSVIKVESAYLTLPPETFVWTLVLGVTVAVMYSGLGRRLPGSPVVKGLLFGGVVFGIDWMLFTQVVPVLFEVSPFEWVRSYIVRVVIDCAAIALGVAVSAEGRGRPDSP